MNGYNFTERVRKVLAFAREESARLHHEYVGTEHILLALIRENGGVGATVLHNLGVDPEELSQRVHDVVKKGKSDFLTGPDLPYTSRAKKVLELAMAQARELDHSYVGTEHLLLGLLAEEKGIAAQILVDAGITLDAARDEIVRILEGSPTATSPQPAQVLTVRRMKPKYTDRLQTVIDDAHRVAIRCGSAAVTPIHATIALLEHGDGMANTALDHLGLNRTSTLAALNRLAARGSSAASAEGLTHSADLTAILRVMEASPNDEQSFAPETHHFLLSVLTLPDIATPFAGQGITVDTVRSMLLRISG